ncbi:flavodoxin family protein [Mycolicibacterium gilvum]|uniref:Multimeric flavodoxin WrbA n=1 Tax=Mycolicibacterium gilvum (strain DSM 45189 / LMG 24558 / Spyr1) TaxID=278137 RepID=E6TM60_MYCSR|nr:flavodoxin family protein [Mycolicibacterium gilvum]ADT99346.1 multimeric flavodoxin WrbA [Mycolicibacterium gilvum Spyr1]
MNSAGESNGTRVLLVYYSYTGQTQKVLDAAADVLRERGCEVTLAPIEFVDPQYSEPFTRFPMRSVWPDMFSVYKAQGRGETGEIRTPDAVRDGRYDLVIFGSPTWWDTVSMPLRSFLESGDAKALLDGTPYAVVTVCRRLWRGNLEAVRELADKQGGRFADSIHFEYPGGQLTSLLSLASYLGSGEYKERYLGVKIPTTNISAGQVDQARSFAGRLADRLFGGR